MTARVLSLDLVEEVVGDGLRRFGVPGAAVAIVRDGEPWLARGFGVRGPGMAHPVGTATSFALASCTKPFVSATAAWLVHEGALAWDDPIRRHLPWLRFTVPGVADQVTLRDLLCHRLGLDSSEHDFRRTARTRLELGHQLGRQRFLHPFRETYAYCTDAFSLAGQVVEAVTGTRWETVAAERVWRPLGMERTDVGVAQARAAGDWAAPHVDCGDEARPVAWHYEDCAVPAGGVNSCAEDMTRWLAALAAGGGVALPRGALAELLTPHTPMRGPHADRELEPGAGCGRGGLRHQAAALGWFVADLAGELVTWHSGGIDGFRAHVGLLPDRRFGAAVLTNGDRHGLSRGVFVALAEAERGRPWQHVLARFEAADRHELAARRADAAREEATRDATVPPSLPLPAYGGRFVSEGPWPALEVEPGDDGGLRARAGALALRLDHWSGDTFAATERDASWRGRLALLRFEVVGGAAHAIASSRGWRFVRDAATGDRRCGEC